MQQEGRRYRVLEAVGRGGFGTVYKAELLSAGGFRKRVALKVLNAEVAQDTEFSQRLRDEARMLGLLDHRAVVRVDGLAMLGGRWTVVMEFIDGVDLKRLIKGGAVPLGPALEITEEVAAALHAVYDAPQADGRALRLLHRDIKPSNIQLTPGGSVKVLDFGVARADFDQRESETRSRFFGSAAYMAPERLDAIDSHAGDVYAVGAVFVELITGEPVGRTSANAERHAACIDRALSRLEAGADPEIAQVAAACLAFDPKARPSARALARTLRVLRARYLDQPWLRDWSERAVPPLLAQRPAIDDDLSGSILEEDSGTMDWLQSGADHEPSGPSEPSSFDPEPSRSGPIVSGAQPASATSAGPPPAADEARSEAIELASTSPTASADAPRERDLGGLVLALSAGAGLVAVLAVALVGAVVMNAMDEAAPPQPVTPSESAEHDRLVDELAADDGGPGAEPAAEASAPSEGAAGAPAPDAAPPGRAPSASRGAAEVGDSDRPTSARSGSADRGEGSPPPDAAAAQVERGDGRGSPAADEPAIDEPPPDAAGDGAEAAPASSGATAQVLVASPGVSVRLIGPAGALSPGAVPVGTYSIEARFSGGEPVVAGTLTLAEGEVVRLSCRSALKRCIPRR